MAESSHFEADPLAALAQAADLTLPAWLAAACAELHLAFDAGKAPQAILLNAPTDSGKTLLATRLAADLLCSEPGQNACGRCQNCQLLRAGTHPDCYVVSPPEGKLQISVDQVRDLSVKIFKTAQIAERKMILIEPAEAMNRNAANALLKCLEEPPGNTHFLLCSSYPSRLLATIRSRCQQYKVPPPSLSTAMQWLQANGLSEKQAEAGLQHSPGRPIAVLRHGAEAVEHIGRMCALAEQASQAAKPVTVLSAELKGLSAGEFLDVYYRVIVSATKALQGAEAFADVDSLVRCFESAGVSAADLHRHLIEIGKVMAQIQAGSHLNEQLLIENTFMQLHKLCISSRQR